MKRRSPLTANTVEHSFDSGTRIHWFEDICGRWGITEEALDDVVRDASISSGCLQLDAHLSERATRATFALARSQVWRLDRERQRPLFMTKGGKLQLAERDVEQVILTFDDLYEDANRLSLERKALATLDNLANAESEVGAGIDVPYNVVEFPGAAGWGPADEPFETGISYGSTQLEAPMIYQLLVKRGLLRPLLTRGPGRTLLHLTPEGYATVSEMRSGEDRRASQAFFVCRFIPEIDMLFNQVVRPVGRELGCPILRIKDIHHNDKIDDRICQEIQRSTVVLVDLTKENFNVGFEAGYAIALGKPIVWMRKAVRSTIKMPFDISTYNCLGWEHDKLEVCRENLKHRMITALQLAQRRARA